MTHPAPRLAVTGSAMDKIVPKRRSKFALIALIAVAAVLVFGFVIWFAMPRGLQVTASDVRIATVERGMFEDNLVVRANAEPLHSIILDSIESGRVEEVMVHDGVMVEKNQLLFRLSNPQRNIELLARQAELAQQISNLSNLRVAQETGRTEHQRRLSDLQFSLMQSEKLYTRNINLAKQGFISTVALDESHDQLLQQQRALKQEQESSGTETAVRADAQAQMELAIKGLQSGIQIVKNTVEALSVRAPAAGRLTGFGLQVGETVKTDQHIGRIDDSSQFKLSSQIDEFYLDRVRVGRKGVVRQMERDYPVEIRNVYPQIKEGRFAIEMVFTKDQPDQLNPGQSLDAQVTFGDPTKAILLPNGTFINDSGGAWVYVVDGDTAVRREIKIGRRNNRQVEVLSGLTAGERVIISGYAAFGKSAKLQLIK